MKKEEEKKLRPMTISLKAEASGRDFAETLSESDAADIDASLNEIYHDEQGSDVTRLIIKKRRGWFYWLGSLLFASALAFFAYYFGYDTYLARFGSQASADLQIEGQSEVLVNEPLKYTITYKNNGKIALKNVRLEVSLPAGFVADTYYPEADKDKKGVWTLPDLSPGHIGRLSIDGTMISMIAKTGVLESRLTYVPANFSSEFKQEETFGTTVSGSGLESNWDYVPSALVGQSDIIKFHFRKADKSHLDRFRLSAEPKENLELSLDSTLAADSVKIAEIRPGVWDISEIGEEEQILPIKYRFVKKDKPVEEVPVYLEHEGQDGVFRRFQEEKLSFEVMDSDLNLSLIVNGSREDKGINFGDTLNFSLVYVNRGETDLKDVIIMAVIDGPIVDWSSLQDENKGKEKGNTITWSKEEIAALAQVARGQEGSIDFSIKTIKPEQIAAGMKYEVKSYAQFSVGSSAASKEDARSSIITNKVNSDLAFSEAVRYFSEDNEPVGSGPHPPKVAETTTYKVFWTLRNSLHELSDIKATTVLPEGVSWLDRSNVRAGEIKYDEASRTITWSVNRLPVTVTESGADFFVSVTPKDDDYDKILVLTKGVTVTAMDKDTDSALALETKAKTSKLDDDEIATGDGRVVK